MSRARNFSSKFYQTFKEDLRPISFKLAKKEEERAFSNSFYGTDYPDNKTRQGCHEKKIIG